MRQFFWVVSILVFVKLLFLVEWGPMVVQWLGLGINPIVHTKPCVLKVPPPPDPSRRQNYSLAYRESLGFFDDIPEDEWELQRAITRCRVNTEDSNHPMRYARSPRTWYQKNWDPDFSCRHEAKVGVGDGGKWICDPFRLKRTSDRRVAEEDNGGLPPLDDKNKKTGCLIYSVGSEGDFRFELGIQDLLPGACEIHTFDFTDFSHKVPPGRNIHFHNWGLKPSYQETKGTSRFHYPWQWFGQFSHANGNFKTFEETKKALGHEGWPIDVFKIDCEGCEWGTYKDWINADIRQLLVEVHMVPEVANDFFTHLQLAGYVTFHKEPNIQYGGGIALEYSMIKLSTEYVEDRIA